MVVERWRGLEMWVNGLSERGFDEVGFVVVFIIEDRPIRCFE